MSSIRQLKLNMILDPDKVYYISRGFNYYNTGVLESVSEKINTKGNKTPFFTFKTKNSRIVTPFKDVYERRQKFHCYELKR